jgi:hypothetical protein
MQEDSVAAQSEKQDNNYGWDINLGGPPRWWTVTWVADELRGKIQRNGQVIADLWPEAVRRSAQAKAEAPARDLEAEP